MEIAGLKNYVKFLPRSKNYFSHKSSCQNLHFLTKFGLFQLARLDIKQVSRSLYHSSGYKGHSEILWHSNKTIINHLNWQCKRNLPAYFSTLLISLDEIRRTLHFFVIFVIFLLSLGTLLISTKISMKYYWKLKQDSKDKISKWNRSTFQQPLFDMWCGFPHIFSFLGWISTY